MAKTNLKLVKKTENKDLAAALEVAKGLQETMGEPFEYLKNEDFETSGKVISLVIDAQRKLSQIKDTLDYCDVDLCKLEGLRFEATVKAVHEIYRILDAAVELHSRTH